MDRHKMGALVFENAAERKRLNAALHLPILVETARQVVVAWLRHRSLVVRASARHADCQRADSPLACADRRHAAAVRGRRLEIHVSQHSGAVQRRHAGACH